MGNEYARDYMRQRYHERLAEIKRHLGEACAQCGATDSLQVDHRDWRAKAMTVARMTMVGRSRFLVELAKCQLLCEPCHRVKSAQDLREMLAERGLRSFNQVPEDAYHHGTPRMALYRRCRCVPCRAAARAYRQRLVDINGACAGGGTADAPGSSPGVPRA